MLLLLLSFLLPWLIGFAIVILCFRESFLERFVLKSFLGLGTGMGITSSLYFFFSLVFDPSQRFYFIIEGFLLVALLMLVFLDQRLRNHPHPALPIVSLPQTVLLVVLAAFFVLALWSAVDVFSKLTLSEPHGRYDAWAIWNYRARFIFRGGAHWLEAVSPLQFHPDYPLLTPLSISRIWLFMNVEVQKAIILLAGLFTFGSIGLAASALANIRKISHGLLAAFLLASTGMYIYNGAILFADVPQSFFVLSAVVTAYLAVEAGREKPGLASLAGLIAGFCGWVKNEGLMFLAVGAGVTLAVYLISSIKRYKPFIWNYLAGMALPLITILYFKFLLSPQNDLVNPGNMTTIFEKFIDLERYDVIAKEGLSYFLAFGSWNIPILVVLILFAIIGFRKTPSDKLAALWAVILMVLFQAGGYILIYLITPFDLTLHIRQSILRLIVHIYPSFLFVLFLLIKTPEEIFSRLIPAQNLEQKSSGQ